MSNIRSIDTEKQQTQKNEENNNNCFIIMPISDPETYEPGHFERVYEDIFEPACKMANLNPIRVDKISGTSLIQLDILQELLKADMAICDLSSANPNVMFELGIRQAFDKPTVLVQEEGNKPIFDIGSLKYCTYRKSLLYHEVLKDQEKLVEFLNSTKQSFQTKEKINSIVSLLALTEASFSNNDDINDPSLYKKYLTEEINQIKNEIHKMANNNSSLNSDTSNTLYGTILISINRLSEMIKNGTPNNIINRNFNDIYSQVLDITDLGIRTYLLNLLEEVKINIVM